MTVCFYILKVFLKKYYFFLCFKLIFFLIFLYHFDALISKLIFKKYKKYYLGTFLNEKNFEKQP